MPGGPNKAIYENRFKEMSDDEFDVWIQRMERKEIRLSIIAPNQMPYKLDLERNLKLGKEWGHEFYQRIYRQDSPDGPVYLTNERYLVMDIQLRPQAQMIEKKMRIPRGNNSIDDLTGQPTGVSKGSKISYPEMQVLAALNLPRSITETMKYRGGDIKGFNAMNAAIDRTGAVSLDAIEHLAGEVESTKTLATILNCMHLQNTLVASKR